MKEEDTVYTLFLDMIKFELNFGTYWIYLALKRSNLRKYAPVWKVSRVAFSEEEIAQIYEMDRRDVLVLNRVKLFATQVAHITYAFYFAHKVDEAVTLHEQIYGTTPLKWHRLQTNTLTNPLTGNYTSQYFANSKQTYSNLNPLKQRLFNFTLKSHHLDFPKLPLLVACR